MIAIDSSAIVAMMLREIDADRYADVLANSATAIAAPTLVEIHIVLVNRKVPNARTLLDRMIGATGTDIMPFTAEMADLAHAAFLTFGKGRHPAALNYGDCMAYALAKSLDAPLLFKGEDFALTDIRSALA